MLQYVAVCCSVLQCVAVAYRRRPLMLNARPASTVMLNVMNIVCGKYLVPEYMHT